MSRGLLCGWRLVGGMRHALRRPTRSLRSRCFSFSLSLVLLLGLSFHSHAVSASGVWRRLERFEASSRYEQLERAAPDREFLLVIGLEARDAARMESLFWQLSDPQHPKYAAYLTHQELAELSKPHENALVAIQNWLALFVEPHRVIHSTVTNRLKVPITIANLEALFQTQVHAFRHRHTHRVLLRASQSLQIPSSIAPFIAFLNVNSHPLLLRASASQSSMATESFNSVAIQTQSTLDMLYRLYDIPKNEVITNETNLQCLPSFYEESWDPNDLKLFLQKFAPEQPAPRIVEFGERDNIPSHASTEASLDIQYLVATAPNATTVVWTMNGTNPYSTEDEPFLEFAEAVLAMEHPPLVVSISYSDDEEHVFKASADYARAFDKSLIQMGLRGISVLVASGDDGAAGLRLEFEKIPEDQWCQQHGPQWPSSSPYITSVGATMLLTASNTGNKNFFVTKDEVICSREMGSVITSGGGFSNVYSRPAYQFLAVESYLRTPDIPSASFFNASGRAYPDVSAFGNAFEVYLKGSLTQISGTSAATPTVAAMVTRWNDLRLNAGKKPLGFLNPLLYQLAQLDAQVFHDVVVGNNGALKKATKICDESFVATSGWDAVSGVGTPNYTAIRRYITQLGDSFNFSNLSAESVVTGCLDPFPTTSASSSPWSGIAAVICVAAVAVAVVGLAVHTWNTQKSKHYASLNSDSPQVSVGDLKSSTESKTEGDQEAVDDPMELSEINLAE